MWQYRLSDQNSKRNNREQLDNYQTVSWFSYQGWEKSWKRIKFKNYLLPFFFVHYTHTQMRAWGLLHKRSSLLNQTAGSRQQSPGVLGSRGRAGVPRLSPSALGVLGATAGTSVGRGVREAVGRPPSRLISLWLSHPTKKLPGEEKQHLSYKFFGKKEEREEGKKR